MMKIVNTTPAVLKHQIEEAITKAVANYRTDYPNDTAFTRSGWRLYESVINERTVPEYICTECKQKNAHTVTGVGIFME